MKAKRFFTTCMMAALLCVSISAQNQTPNDKARKQQKPTPEEMVTKHTEGMQRRLLLDDATAEKFAPIYKEYLTALQQCRKCTEPKKELTDAERTERIENGFAAQKKRIETQETYYKKLKKILNARQLEIVFSQQKHHPKQGDRKRPQAPMQMQSAANGNHAPQTK